MRAKKILVCSVALLIIFVGVSVYVFRRNYVVPILMYHSISSQPVAGNRLVVAVQSFERQMRFLSEHRYNCVTIAELVEMLAAKRKLPARTVAITFDDGYRNNFSLAYPILKKYKVPATVFLIVNEIGRPDRLQWEEIREMRDSGYIAFGSHCLGPEPLVNLKTSSEREWEIFESKKILEEKLGISVPVFSYPEGRFTPEIKEMVRKAGYKGAVATNPGKSSANDDVYALKRLRISSTSDNLFVFWVETSGYYNYMRENRRK
jgi:peptidoglycan/xylan/chitin deacetylase (PgdA/CDA1 family)